MANVSVRATWGAVIVAAGLMLGCGLRQNMRNEFLSFRGAWFCDKSGCSEGEMQQSSKGTDEGGTRVLYGKLQPTAALVFNAGAEVETFTATVADCKGKSMPVPDDKLKKPGDHGIAGESDSWVVLLDKGDLSDLKVDSSGKCSKLVVTARATWPKGTSYEDKGAIAAE